MGRPGQLKIVDVPKLINIWDWNKNKHLDPYSLSHGSSVYANWVCSNGHSYNSKIRNQFWFGCKNCRESKGERRVAEYLDRRGFVYEREYRFPDLARLPYDFAVFLPRLLLIEFDGRQHYEPVSFGSSKGGEFKLLQTRWSDTIKDINAEFRRTPLLRISYVDMDKTETILDSFFSRFK